MKKYAKQILHIWLGLLLIFPFVLWLLPATFFDNGQSICPSKVFFDIECFGCGMTRAIMHLHHLEIDEAIWYNTAVLFFYPALVVIWGFWVYKAYQRIRQQDLSASS